MMAAVFSMQGTGQFVCALVALIVTLAFRDSFIHTTSAFSSCDVRCQLAGDRAWRIIVGFGAVPAVFALYYRITIPETPRYTFDIAHDIEKADADIRAYVNHQKEGEVDLIRQQKVKASMGKHLSTPKASWRDVYAYFSEWKNFKVIVGTTSSWFFFGMYILLFASPEVLCFVSFPLLQETILTPPDLAFYGLGLNNSAVLSAIGFSTGDTIYDTLRNNAVGNLVLVCAGSIPGYWLSVLTIDTIGRKPIQIIGFFLLTVIFTTIGFAHAHLSTGGLFALYVFAQLFFNFGPNTTTFIIPGECFPTRYRSTGHGLSAAMGKIGAIVAQVMAQPLMTKGAPADCTGNACSPWLHHIMQIFALFMLCGMLVSFLVPETKGRTLEELAGESSTALDLQLSSKPTPPGWAGALNPFTGGYPAGFAWRSPTLGPKKRVRVGIMTSPELIPKGGEKGKWTSHTRETSYENGDSGSGSASSGERREADDEGLAMGTGNVLPGWGAGWNVQGGRMPDSRRSDGRVESIQLNDVGKLLK
jgi:PHS family inorganic phosphate transporter-like MFS transporter